MKKFDMRTDNAKDLQKRTKMIIVPETKILAPLKCSGNMHREESRSATEIDVNTICIVYDLKLIDFMA